MGYIDSSGKYHKQDAKLNDIVPSKTSVWKSSDHDRQRQDHKRDLIRPYLPNGDPNPEFIQEYREESINTYNFIKSDEDIAKEQ